MKYYNRKYLWLWGICSIVLLLFGIILLWNKLPYQSFASRKIISILESNNISISSLKVEKASNSEIIFSNIKLTGNQGLSVEHLEVKYNMQKLISGKIENFEAENIEVNLYKKDGHLQVSGLEKFLSDNSQNNHQSEIPTDNDALLKILPENISIKNLNVSAKDGDSELSLPLNVTFGFKPLATLNIDSPAISLKSKLYQLTTANMHSQVLLGDNKKWQGDATISSIKIDGLEQDMPALEMKAKFSLVEENLQANVFLKDTDNTIKADIELSLPIESPTSGNLNIKQIQFPWGGGVISSEAVHIPLDIKKPVLFNVNLKNVDLSEVLVKVSNGRVKGTGRISGTFPIIYNPDGTIVLKDGMAEEINAGTISVSPDLLPGNNEQLEFARTTLENFHYTKLKIVVSSKEGKSAINLVLGGKNPDSASERPINFNINLTGDIMPLIQQSIIPFNDITKLLKQEKQ